MKIFICLFACATIVNAGFFSALFGGLTSSDPTKNPSDSLGPGGQGFGRGGPPISLLAAAGGRHQNPSALVAASYAGGLGGGGSRNGYSHGGGYAQGFGGGSPSLIFKQSPGGYTGIQSTGTFNNYNGGSFSALSPGYGSSRYGNGGSSNTIKVIHQGSGSNGGNLNYNNYGVSSGAYSSFPQKTIKLIQQKPQSVGLGGGYGGGYSAGHSLNAEKTIKFVNQGGYSQGNSYANGGLSTSVAFPSNNLNVGSDQTIRIIHDKLNTNIAYGNSGSSLQNFKVINQASSHGGDLTSYAHRPETSGIQNYKTIRIVSEPSTGGFSSNYLGAKAGPAKTIKIISDSSANYGGNSYAGSYSHGSSNSHSNGDGATKTVHVIKEEGGFIPSQGFGSNPSPRHQAEDTVHIIDDAASTGGYTGGSSSSYSTSHSANLSPAYSSVYSGDSTSDYKPAYSGSDSTAFSNEGEQTIKIITDDSDQNNDFGNVGYSSSSYSPDGSHGNEQTLQIIDDGSSNGYYNGGFSNDYSSNSAYSGSAQQHTKPSSASSYYSSPTNSYKDTYANSYSSYSDGNSYSGSQGSEGDIKTLQIIGEGQSNGISNDYSSGRYSTGHSNFGNPNQVKTIKIIHDNSIDNSVGSYSNDGSYGQQDDIKTIKIINEDNSNYGNSYSSGNNYSGGSGEHIKTIQILDEHSRYKTKK